jgi:hypothetical protein
MPYIGYQPSQLATAPFAVNTFTGDGSTTTFTLSQAVPGANEAMVEVVVENVQQNPIDAYTIGGGTNTSLIFSEAPISGAAIYVIHKGEGTYNLQPSTGSVTSTSLDPVLRNFTVDTFTGNASATTYTLTDTPYSANSIIVTVDGILQTATTNYTVSGTTLSFGTDAPASGAAITVLHLGFSTGNKSVADGTITPTKISSGGPYWTSTGNVGVGTTSPLGRLHVQNSGNSATSADNSSIYVSATNRTGYVQLDSVNGANGSSSVIFSAGGTEQGRILYKADSNYMWFSTATTERMRIDSAGLVGIGNSAPAYRLDILQAVDGVSGINVRNTSAGTSARAVVLLSQDTNVAASAIWVNSSLNTNFAGASSLNLYNGLNAPIGFFTGGTERIRIDASGNVGIATTSPSTYGKFAVVGDGYFSGNLGIGVTPTSKLHVVGSSNVTAVQILPQGALPDNNDNAGLYILHQGTTGTAFRARTDNAVTGSVFAHVLVNNASANINSAFQVSHYGTGAIATFDKSGTVALKVNANGIGIGATTPSSGIGIAFPATQSASSDANTLDDYEEGTWTPVFQASGTSFTHAANYGTYVKIGSLVHAQFYLRVTAYSGSNSNSQIGGLPFSSANINSYHQSPGQMWSTTAPSAVALVGNNTNAADLWKNDTSVTIFTASEIIGKYFVGTLIYRSPT